MSGTRATAWIFFFIVAVPVSLYGCGSSRGDSDSGGDGTTSTVEGNLDTISDDFTPESLVVGSSSSSSLVKDNGPGSDPCAESEDLYDCQPVLVRLYIDMAHDFLDMTNEIIAEVGSHLGSLPDGSSGDGDFEGRTIHYSKTSSSQFSILMEQGSSPSAYFNVNGTVYTLKMNLDNLEEAGDSSGQLEIVVQYDSDESWSIVVFLAGMDCDSNDTRAPERIHIRVAKSGGFWTGKAMFYNGVWQASDPTCSTEASNDLAINFYTDFVANDTAARASVYLMPRTKSDLSDIEDFGMDGFAINFSNNESTSAYANPFCNPASTLDAVWSDDCTTTDSTVGSASYGAASDWILPSEFFLETVTLPSSL